MGRDEEREQGGARAGTTPNADWLAAGGGSEDVQLGGKRKTDFVSSCGCVAFSSRGAVAVQRLA
jgi:hypothetical protein